MKNMVDWSVIDKYEITTSFGYAIPNDEKSGITIGSGFDLGQHSVQQIDALPISENLKVKLIPFAGLKGAAARNTLYKVPKDGAFDPRQPLSSQIQSPARAIVSNKQSSAHILKSSTSGLDLDPAEIVQLNDAVRSNKLNKIIQKYDLVASRDGGIPFSTIPASCQTAITSFCWQYGENINTKDVGDRRRKYWDLIVKGDWTNTVEHIFSAFMGVSEKNFARRRMEEIYLFYWGFGTQQSGPLLKMHLDKSFDTSRIA